MMLYKVREIRKFTKNGELRRYHYIAGQRGSFWRSTSHVEEGSQEYYATYKERLAGEPGDCLPKFVRDELARLMKKAKWRAKSSARPFDLDALYMQELYVRQGGVCAISKLRFKLKALSKSKSDPFSMSLDRIDSHDGYTKGNIRLVLLLVNYGMSTWGAPVFRKVCRAVAERGIEGDRKHFSETVLDFPGKPNEIKVA